MARRAPAAPAAVLPVGCIRPWLRCATPMPHVHGQRMKGSGGENGPCRPPAPNRRGQTCESKHTNLSEVWVSSDVVHNERLGSVQGRPPMTRNDLSALERWLDRPSEWDDSKPAACEGVVALLLHSPWRAAFLRSQRGERVQKRADRIRFEGAGPEHAKEQAVQTRHAQGSDGAGGRRRLCRVVAGGQPSPDPLSAP